MCYVSEDERKNGKKDLKLENISADLKGYLRGIPINKMGNLKDALASTARRPVARGSTIS